MSGYRVRPLGGPDIETIRQWRLLWSMTGLPSGLDDYFVCNGFCCKCRGTGKRAADWSMNASFCGSCRGSGLQDSPAYYVFMRTLIGALEGEGDDCAIVEQ